MAQKRMSCVTNCGLMTASYDADWRRENGVTAWQQATHRIARWRRDLLLMHCRFVARALRSDGREVGALMHKSGRRLEYHHSLAIFGCDPVFVLLCNAGAHVAVAWLCEPQKQNAQVMATNSVLRTHRCPAGLIVLSAESEAPSSRPARRRLQLSRALCAHCTIREPGTTASGSPGEYTLVQRSMIWQPRRKKAQTWKSKPGGSTGCPLPPTFEA